MGDLIKLDDVIVEREKDRITFYFLDFNTKKFRSKTLSKENVRKLVNFLYTGFIKE